MKQPVVTLENKKVGDIDLSDNIFGLEPRSDILQRMVNWQLAKRRRGTHDVKNRSEVARTGSKLGRQKGGGRARHGSARVNIFRGGGRAFGPTPRDYVFSLTKKFRSLALKMALSSKMKEHKLVVVDDLSLKSSKTKEAQESLQTLGLSNALFIGGVELDKNAVLAFSNVPNVDMLPVQGVNVYDVLRRDTLVLSKEAVEKIGDRLQ